MSWTDIFPVLDDMLLNAYRQGVGDEERREFEGWFGVERVVGGRADEGRARNGWPRHIVSATLFWKHVNGQDPDLPPPTRETLVDARRMGLVKRFDPWGSYIAPLIDTTPAALSPTFPATPAPCSLPQRMRLLLRCLPATGGRLPHRIRRSRTS